MQDPLQQIQRLELQVSQLLRFIANLNERIRMLEQSQQHPPQQFTLKRPPKLKS